LTHFSVIRACHDFDKLKKVERMMRAILTIVITAFVLSSSPAAAAQLLIHNAAFAAKPHAVAVISVARQRIEMIAVTRRARADTPLRRAHLYECEAMAKVMPGYPQPAFVSIDFRVNF
jgi:PhoPQ-activated pathogenicity-related protein